VPESPDLSRDLFIEIADLPGTPTWSPAPILDFPGIDGGEEAFVFGTPDSTDDDLTEDDLTDNELPSPTSSSGYSSVGSEMEYLVAPCDIYPDGPPPLPFVVEVDYTLQCDATATTASATLLLLCLRTPETLHTPHYSKLPHRSLLSYRRVDP
jgi:hypothetical protein